MRSFPAEHVVHEVVFRGAGKVFDAADNVVDLHQMVVYHVREIVGRHTVRLDKDIVFHIRVGHAYMPENEVVVFAYAFGRYVLAYDERFARRKFGFYLFFGKGEAVFVVFMHARFVVAAESSQPLFCAEAVIRAAQFHQLFRVFHIYRLAFALNVRTVTLVFIGTFVVLNARRPESAVDDVYRAFYVALPVGIFYSQHEIAAVLFSEKVGVKAGTQVAYMHEARRGGGESCSYFLFHLENSVSGTRVAPAVKFTYYILSQVKAKDYKKRSKTQNRARRL